MKVFIFHKVIVFHDYTAFNILCTDKKKTFFLLICFVDIIFSHDSRCLFDSYRGLLNILSMLRKISVDLVSLHEKITV